MSVWFGNTSTLVVHAFDCNYAAVMNPENLELYEDLYSSLSDGYEECFHCIGGGREIEKNRVVLGAVNSNIRDKCLCCGEIRGVQAAHIIPKRDGGTATMPLCPNCHWNFDHGLMTPDEYSKITQYCKKEGVLL